MPALPRGAAAVRKRRLTQTAPCVPSYDAKWAAATAPFPRPSQRRDHHGQLCLSAARGGGGGPRRRRSRAAGCGGQQHRCGGCQRRDQRHERPAPRGRHSHSACCAGRGPRQRVTRRAGQFPRPGHPRAVRREHGRRAALCACHGRLSCPVAGGHAAAGLGAHAARRCARQRSAARHAGAAARRAAPQGPQRRGPHARLGLRGQRRGVGGAGARRSGGGRGARRRRPGGG